MPRGREGKGLQLEALHAVTHVPWVGGLQRVRDGAREYCNFMDPEPVLCGIAVVTLFISIAAVKATVLSSSHECSHLWSYTCRLLKSNGYMQEARRQDTHLI